MRAWLLLLAVLATFQPIVQVASTEDITSRFIQAISPLAKQLQQQQQQQQQATSIKYEDNRDTRRTFNTQSKVVTKNTANVTALSPVIDITTLSVISSSTPIGEPAAARSTITTDGATAIATTIFSSDSANSKNKNNTQNKIIAKDNSRENISENTSVVKQTHKNNKQNPNHNEVNDKSARNILDNSTKQTDSATVSTHEYLANKVQQLENTNNNNQIKSTINSKSTRKQKEKENSVVLSEKEAEEKVNENLSEMAIEENQIATAHEAQELNRKRHRHHRQQHEKRLHYQRQLPKNSQQQHQSHQHQHQHHHQHHKQALSATVTPTALDERLANAEETAAAHKEAAEKLAQDSARALNDRISDSMSESTSTTQLPSVNFTASASSSAPPSSATHTAAADDDDDAVDADSDDSDDSHSEPATYSNKEIIGEKLNPDPSTLVQIENSLLSLFNMKRPPKIDRSKIIIPEAMKQLYAQIMGHELDSVMIPRPGILTKSANTVRSFTHIESKIDDRFPHHHRFRLYFDVKSIPTEEKLKAAELQLSRNAISEAVLNARLANRTRYQVLVYDITRVGVRGKREPSYLLLDNKAVRLNSTEIVSLDVQPAVDRWLATPKKNYGLLIEVRTPRSLKPAPHHHVRLRRSADEPHESWQHKQPVLYTYTDDGKHKSRPIRDVSSRSKRAGHHRRAHRRKNSDEICRRHSLYVDFADVGWSDWIVAPPGYDAFYCQGKCPFPLAEHMNSTNHAVVQTLVNNLNPGKVPKACCVPTQLEGISMLYLNDQNTVVLKNYQDMTVVGCGCR